MDFQVNLLLLALVFCSLSESQAQTCGDIGTNAQEFTESREQKFFLNTQDPAPCDGTIDQFEYCYYLTDQFSFVHLFTFAVYRETSPGSNTYSPISDPFITGTSFLDHGQNNFTCKTFQADQSIQVQAGDIIGACIYDPTDRFIRTQLDVVGREAGSDRFLMSATDNSGCNNSAVPNSVSGLTRADSFVLHVYASIVPLPTTTPPAVATTTVVPTPKTSEILTATVTLPAIETSSVVSTFAATSSVTVVIATTSSVVIAAPVSTAMSATSTIVIETSSTGTPVPSVAPVASSTVASTSETLALPTSTSLMLTTAVPDASTTSTPDVVTSSTALTTTQENTPTTDSISPSVVIMSTLTSTGVAVAPTSTSIKAKMSTSTSTAQLLASSMQEASSSQTILSTVTLLTTSIPTIATSSVQASVESPEMTSSLEIQTTTTLPPPQSTDEDTMATTPSSTEASSGGMTVIIIAIVMVIVIVVIAVAVVIFLVWVRKRRKRKQTLELTPGFVNVTYTTRTSASNEAVVINDIYDDTTFTDNFKEDLENTYSYASGTYYVAMETHDVPKAVTNTSPLFDSAYAECGPYDEIRPQLTSYGDATVKFSDLLGEDERREIYDQLSPYQAPASEENEIYGQLKSWGTRSIPRSDIQIVGHLGSGQYGSVDQGIWKAPKSKPVDVALKSLTKASGEDKLKFLQEAAIMAQFRHPNVIELYGVVIRGTPTLIVGELAVRGDLRTFLHKLREIARDPNLAQLLLKCSYQVALGMEYLSAKGFVHRDLAARNVLVTKDHICKIADFGMSRDLADENYYVSQGKDKIPVKWTAPEALHYKKYSTASDVWAYGCLLYEIWSIGHKPFEGITNQEAIRLIDSGKRLSPPPGCPKMIYELMILCWHPQTMVRPTFQRTVLTFVGNGDTILEVPKKDSSTKPLAGVLGAPLEAGENMYSQLQRRYRNYDHRAVVETEDDYFNPTSF